MLVECKKEGKRIKDDIQILTQINRKAMVRLTPASIKRKKLMERYKALIAVHVEFGVLPGHPSEDKCPSGVVF